ncbi:MAG: ABC transporter substrate-binding protein [Ignavibacteria bacterium]|nr:ABC transporter substrate-binding protein [Ignavibacteria bacterium]
MFKKPSRKSRLICICFSAVFSLTLAACSGKKKDGQTTLDDSKDNMPAPADTNGAVVGDWIVIREMADPEKLNPIVSNDASASEICSYMFESLLGQSKETYELIPALAELPEVSSDNLTYTFRMNKNARFSDGKPLTGNDVIFTLKFIKNPFVDNAAMRNYYEMIEKAELVDGDPYKVKFTLEKPNWRAIYTLAGLQVLPKHVLDPENITDKFQWSEFKDMRIAAKNPDIKKFADFVNSQEVSRSAKYLIGSGPYVFEKWETGAGVTIRRNPDYWGKNLSPNYPNKIIFKTIQDNSAALVAAKNKEIDAMYVIKPSDFYNDLKNPEQFKLIKARPFEPAYAYLAWNQKNPLFKDRKVRWALSHLVDRKTIIERVLFGDGVPIQSHIFYKNKKLLNENLPVIEYDPEKAKKLLEEAGWKDTDGNGILDKMIDGKKVEFKFTFLSNTNPVRKQILLVIVDALKKVGIQAEVQELEWSVYLDKTKKHEFDATYSAWTSPTTPPDPYQIWHSSQAEGEGSNYISFINKENDSLIEAYRNEMDEAKRIEIIKKWQQLIYDEQPYTFLWSPRSRYVYDSRFKNTRWYNYQPSPSYNEWWVPQGAQKYTQNMNY